jgi:hypothetical protein
MALVRYAGEFRAKPARVCAFGQFPETPFFWSYRKSNRHGLCSGCHFRITNDLTKALSGLNHALY